MKPDSEQVFDILHSDYKAYADFPGHGSCHDVLGYGFSFIESQDHMVEHIITSPKVLKKLISEVDDIEIDPEGDAIAKVWTADIMLSNKLSNDQIVFSNGGQTAVLFLKIDQNKIGVN
jgi:hypothetical protein